jgi:hypothetical protein
MGLAGTAGSEPNRQRDLRLRRDCESGSQDPVRTREGDDEKEKKQAERRSTTLR